MVNFPIMHLGSELIIIVSASRAFIFPSTECSVTFSICQVTGKGYKINELDAVPGNHSNYKSSKRRKQLFPQSRGCIHIIIVT